MATRTWTGGTGTWDATDGTHWSASTAPIAGDTVVFDGTSGGGTVTVAADVAGIAFGGLTAGAFTGTLDFSTNNPNMAFTGSVNLSGSGTRSINLGSGTWTLSSTGTGTIWDVSTTTNLTLTASSATIAFTGASVQRTFVPGASTSYGAWTVSNNSGKGTLLMNSSSVTFGSITIGSGGSLFTQAVTITGALSITGTSSAPSALLPANSANGAVVTVGSASSLDWCGIASITKAGAGSISATNSLDLGRNTGVTITGPSGGGVVGVIGG